VKEQALVVAFGNPLMGDDGVGLAVLARLQKAGLPPSVRLAEGGTDATTLGRLWQGEKKVVLVDAVALGKPAGTIHLLKGEQILQLRQDQAHAHALSLPTLVQWVLLAYPELEAAELYLVGVEPAQLAATGQLSPPVAAAVPAACQEVLNILSAKA
jgi:hydrogenase maturation protease